MVRPERAANFELAVYALWLIGGATGPVDTEDVAAQCWQLAPQRFSWKKFPEYPDKDIVRVALSDAKKKKNGALVRGDGSSGWLLTARGVEWARDREPQFADPARGIGSQSTVSGPALARLKSVRSHRLFAIWKEEGRRPSPYLIADVADATADAPVSIVAEKLHEIDNTALLAGDTEVRRFVAWLQEHLTT